MFSGIITNRAIVSNIKNRNYKDNQKSYHLDITIELLLSNLKKRHLERLENGCSVACNGICLTLTSYQIYRKEANLKLEVSDAEFIALNFTASSETIAKTTIANWQNGRMVNLEFAIAAGEEFGGHFVSGHVDSITKIVDIKIIGDCWLLTIFVPEVIANAVVDKGSIAIDGVSLTVNKIFSNQDGCFCELMIIPYTLANSNLSQLKIGDFCNIEADLFAKHIAKQIANFLPKNS